MVERKGTKQLIAESFMELVQQRGVRNVTVGEVAENCGISHRTFYYHFADKFELIEFVYETALRKAIEHWGSYRDVLLKSTELISEMGGYVTNAAEFVQGVPDPIERMAAKSVEVYRELFEQHDAAALFTEKLEFELYYYNYLTIKAHVDWQDSGEPTSKETIADCILACMPQDLEPLLNGKLFQETPDIASENR